MKRSIPKDHTLKQVQSKHTTNQDLIFNKHLTTSSSNDHIAKSRTFIADSLADTPDSLRVRRAPSASSLVSNQQLIRESSDLVARRVDHILYHRTQILQLKKALRWLKRILSHDSSQI